MTYMYTQCIHDTVGKTSQCGIRSSILISCLRSVSRFDAWRHQLRTRRVSDVSPCSMRLRSSRSSLTMLMRCWMPSCCCLRCCNTQTQWRWRAARHVMSSVTPPDSYMCVNSTDVNDTLTHRPIALSTCWWQTHYEITFNTQLDCAVIGNSLEDVKSLTQVDQVCRTV